MQKGFTLVEILVVIGIMAGTSLITLKMIENQQNGVKYTEVRLNELELYRQVQLNLSMRSACVETFVTRTAPAGVTLSTTGANISAIYQAPPKVLPLGYLGQKIIETGIDYDGYKVSALKIVDRHPSTFGSIGNATLEIHTERLFKGMPKTQRKDMGIYVAKDASDVITDCYIDEDALMKSMCESLEGTWDISVSPPKCIHPESLFETMCLKIGGTWGIPTPPNSIDPTAKECLRIVRGGMCPDGQVLVGYEASGAIKCASPAIQAFHFDPNVGPADQTYNVPGKWRYCALSTTVWNPANDGAPNTKFRCLLSHNNTGSWTVELSRRTDRKDAVRCAVMCF